MPRCKYKFLHLKKTIFDIEASGAGAQRVTARHSVRSPLEMKYLFKFIFPFLRSGVKAKRSVEFRHSTRNVSRIRRKVGNGVS